jgi:hypothetical protein
VNSEDKVRKFVSLAGIAGALVVAACSNKTGVMSDELKKDLATASTSSNAINLGTPQTPGTQIVSAIERTTPPAPRQIAPSQRVVKHRAAPRGLPAPVEVQRADVSPQVEPQPEEVRPTPVNPSPLPSSRPQPVATTGGGRGQGNGSGRADGGGSGIGSILGGIFTVVIRGGGVDGDNCDPRTEGRGGNTSVNNRIPVIGTFPGSGRIGGGFPGGGRGGRTRF